MIRRLTGDAKMIGHSRVSLPVVRLYPGLKTRSTPQVLIEINVQSDLPEEWRRQNRET